jgi:flagellar hook-associated protein 3 FlgL
MRITFRTVHDGVNHVADAADQFVRTQQQVETGKRLLSPSDDPAGMMRVIDGRTELGAIDSYTRSGDTAIARLSVMDNIMSGIIDKLTSAKVAAAQASGDTASPNARATIAATLVGLRDGLVADFNSTFRGRALFGGAETTVQTYAKVAGTWTYQGDHAPVTVEVGRSRDVTIAVDGEAIVKGGDPNDLFTELDALIVAVQAADEPAITAGLAVLDRVFERTIRAQSLVGVDEKSIEDEQKRLTELRLAGQKRVSKDEDANMAAAITEMTQAQIAYEAALQSVGKASRVSLLDYMS